MSLSEQISRVVGGHNDTLKSILVKLGISSASTAKADALNALVANMNIPVGSGGTGKKAWTVNRLIYPSTATTLNQLAFPTTAGAFLRQGTSGAPYWTPPDDVAAAIGVLKEEKGSYVGTGTSGANNPTIITFSHTPKYVVIYMGDRSLLIGNSYSWNSVVCFAWDDLLPDYDTYTVSRVVIQHVKKSGNSLMIYATDMGETGAERQLNTAGKTYHYIALY